MLINIVLLLAFFGTVFLSLYTFGKSDKQATTVPEGEMKFVVQGGNLVNVLFNGRGHSYDRHHGIVETERRLGILERLLGIRWVSIFYPIRRLLEFEITASKLSQDQSKPMERWIVSEKRKVTSLLWKFPRPILALGVELGGDRSRIDLVVLCTFQVKDPYPPIFLYKGKFFEPLEDAVRAAIINYCANKNLTYSTFTTEDKGPSSDFAEHLRTINNPGGTSQMARGIVQEFGIEIMEARLVAFDLSKEDKAFAEASRAKELERLKAEAEEERGKGERKRLEAKAAGEAARWTAPVKELVSMGVDPNVAAQNVGNQIRTQELQGTGITTLVEGGGATPNVSIPIGDRKKPPSKRRGGDRK